MCPSGITLAQYCVLSQELPKYPSPWRGGIYDHVVRKNGSAPHTLCPVTVQSNANHTSNSINTDTTAFLNSCNSHTIHKNSKTPARHFTPGLLENPIGVFHSSFFRSHSQGGVIAHFPIYEPHTQVRDTLQDFTMISTRNSKFCTYVRRGELQ